MIPVLSDHNCIGQARELFRMLGRLKYDALIETKLVLFTAVQLDDAADDETVWQLCQEQRFLLLTSNRRTVDGDLSLEAVVRRNYAPDILPVLTIGDPDRVLHDSDYCKQCAERLAEIIFDLDDYVGVMRLYLP